MTRLDIARHRLHSQRITAPTLENPDDVVGWLVAVQAQDYAERSAARELARAVTAAFASAT